MTGRRAAILIVDDDTGFCEFVTSLCETAGLDVVQAAEANSAMAVARQRHVDAAVVDVELPGLSGYQLCRELRDECGADLPVIFVSGTRTDPIDRAAGILVGGDDYLVKPVDPDELLARVRRLLERAGAWSKPTPTDLSDREVEVLQLVAEGWPPGDVANKLVISPKTVSSHMQRILTKLGVHTRAQAVAVAYEAGLIRVSRNGSNGHEVEAHTLPSGAA
jgi:two-component system nitrate/nitrite response regulator NarL